eukprot:4138602-Amphidinium_carterae.1
MDNHCSISLSARVTVINYLQELAIRAILYGSVCNTFCWDCKEAKQARGSWLAMELGKTWHLQPPGEQKHSDTRKESNHLGTLQEQNLPKRMRAALFIGDVDLNVCQDCRWGKQLQPVMGARLLDCP